MNTDASTDLIDREITIQAPPEDVWAALTEPEAVGTWFGTGAPAKVDLRVGGEMVVDHGPYGSYVMVVVEVDVPRAFAYRWASAYPGVPATEENSTLVRFTLDPVDGGTLLRVVESGFDALVIPPDREEAAGYASHQQGWADVVGKLGDYVTGADRTPMLPPQ
jgi:uncharacterized protein YndB with AHSA1/START domain